MFEDVLSTLEPFAREFSRQGKKVYLVGGAVRNLLLGRPAQDYDFTTDALPSEVQKYFRKVLPTGLQHGTVTVLFQNSSYEVTTFRVDGTYADGRRPDAVTFTPSLEEDLKRRDFTVNGMALDLSDGSLVDPHDGRGDLERRVLRAIGDPGKRFDEDALRLLRLFRFASQLDFEIDPETFSAVASRTGKLQAVSRERIRDELSKALAGSAPGRAWGPLAGLGILETLFAPLEPRPLSDSEIDLLSGLPALLRWPFWLTLTCPARENWEAVLRALKFSNGDISAVLGPSKVWDFLSRTGDLSVHHKGVLEAWGARHRAEAGVVYLRALEAAGYWTDHQGISEALLVTAASADPVFVGDLALGGTDLLKEGVPPGPEIGRTLRRLQTAVWSDPGLNTPDGLRNLLRGW